MHKSWYALVRSIYLINGVRVKIQYWIFTLTPFIHELGLDDFIIGGHSFGGESVLHYLTRLSHKARAAILHGSGAYAPEPHETPEGEAEIIELASNPIGKFLIRYYGTEENVRASLPDYYYREEAITD